VKCGQQIPNPGRLRNVDFEREVTIEASRAAVDPISLIEYAETRASQPHGYVDDTRRVRDDANWLHEMRAELADCRNYACWWLEQNPEDERQQDVLIALRFVALAFDRLC
jgi:hypothetical protein